MEEKVCIFTFHSIHLALEFERLVKSKNLFVKIIPVPRKISSSCGLAGKINVEDLTIIKNMCDENNLDYDNIYKYDLNNNIAIKI